MPLLTSKIEFTDSDFPLLSNTIINQQNIEKDGNTIPISNLVLLPQVLASLDLPPDATTLLVKNKISLVDSLLVDSHESHITNTELHIIDNLTNDEMFLDHNSLILAQPSTTHQTELLGEMLDFQTPQNLISIGHTTYQSGEAGTEAYDLLTGNNTLLSSTTLTITKTSGLTTSLTDNLLKTTGAFDLKSVNTYIRTDGINDMITFYGPVKYKSGFTNVLMTAVNLFKYSSMTFNIGSSSTQPLITVTSSNVGIRILITNMGSNLTIQATAGQLIYGNSSATVTKTINTTDSRMITAIYLSASTYGWSIVE